MSGFKIELGSKVRDKLTGYQGIVWGRTEWLYGCRRYTVQSQEMHNGKPVESISCDEDQLEVVEAAAPHKVRETGGPREDAARPAGVTR